MTTRILLLLFLTSLCAGCGASIAPAPEPAITGLEERAALAVADCDGIAVGDIDGDGTADLLTSSGANGEVFWFDQRAGAGNWTRHRIYEGAAEIEGNDLADYDGDGRLEAISLDQGRGEILLHDRPEDPEGTWNTSVIQSGRGYVQEALSANIDQADEYPELIYTWEGTERDAGGLHVLDLEPGKPATAPESWTDRRMVTHESAWWIVPALLDLDGDGTARELVYTARNLRGRNAGARPGLFWAEPRRDPDAPWARHRIDTTLAHPLHVDAGRFSTEGRGPDLVVGGFETGRLTVYRRQGAAWARSDLKLPRSYERSYEDIWNVKAIPLPGRPRDAMLAIVSWGERSTMVVFQYRDGQYRGQIVREMAYTHPMEDRIALADLTGDDRPELLVPDSGGDQLRIFQVRWSN